MELFEHMTTESFEQVVFCQEKSSGLKAIIAIHDTTLGPALGGTRMWPYEDEEKALVDVLRLAKGMTYKNAAAGLNLGGGKAVIIGDSRHDKDEAMLRAFGRYVQGLGGRYITAEDVGMAEPDMDTIFLETDYVTGRSPATAGGGGNPSPATAYGLYVGMKATAKEAFGSESLTGKTIAVQGVGSVAYQLCKHLHTEGAHLVVTDIHKPSVDQVVKAFNAKAVEPEEIYDVACDIFAPCALGAVINDDTIDRIQAAVIAGSANNQLHTERHGDGLHEKGILYAPDHVINAGGVIHVADELQGYNRERAMKSVGNLYEQMTKVFAIARRDGIPSYQAANRLAEERIKSVGKARKPYVRESKDILS
ncbi:Glu/Leu/Phe/Val dehydrogenase dimerization domain-containing protein [Natribacillus halophilus]|uniref:Leucine dehydrogenase n=1 Tax=Natribacillus halophilus TaxID=549003 RepID=A0A1G8JJ70_9BACI|nr:Glu/Leu/Phe/Val dehydrogenase dimerization domain-containing protein [Natribacillus halophilus]SDI31113.1 leucine dehydrogenase [Natribacillus halophilus]